MEVKPFPKLVCVIIGEGSSYNKTPDWLNKGSIWYAESKESLDKRIYRERGILANYLFTDADDDDQEWCEVVWSLTHHFVEDYENVKEIFHDPI